MHCIWLITSLSYMPIIFASSGIWRRNSSETVSCFVVCAVMFLHLHRSFGALQSVLSRERHVSTLHYSFYQIMDVWLQTRAVCCLGHLQLLPVLESLDGRL